MATTAPSPNSGFVTTGKSPGWVRLWLVNDDPDGPPSDLWAVPGRFYPLAVAKYELASPAPEEIIFDETGNHGGYTRSKGLDEAPYEELPDNVGVFAAGAATFDITTSESPAHPVTMAAGDFFAGNVTAIGEGAPYLFLARI